MPLANLRCISTGLYVLKPDVHAPVCDLGMVGSSHTVSIGLRLTVVSNFLGAAITQNGILHVDRSCWDLDPTEVSGEGTELGCNGFGGVGEQLPLKGPNAARTPRRMG